MKRILLVFLSVLVIGAVLLGSCGEPEETTPTTTQPTSTQPTSTEPTKTEPTKTEPTKTEPTKTEPTVTTPEPTAGPKSGGTLRVLSIQSPSNLSYIPEQNLTDETAAKAYAETLIYWAGDGEFKPELAKSWEIDEASKTLTFYLEEGIMFHDGTPFNAEAVRNNVQLLIDSKRLANGQYVDSIEVVDEYTFRYNLNAMFTPQMMLHSYGYNLLTMFSPTALEQNGKEWAITHFVTTGPFIFDSFERDVSLKMVRNDDYWRGPEYPYLDAIEIIYVADATIAATKMLAGEGDVCAGLPLKEGLDLENQGFVKILQLGGFYTDIVPDTTEGSIFHDKLVREAIEYAIDRDALAAGLGYGVEKAVKRLGPEGTQGYDPNYQPREYDPQKAKELLAQAGFPDGFKTTILQAVFSPTDAAEVIQGFLAEVNIEADIQVEDPGKFFGRIYGEGWSNSLMLFSVPVDPEFAIGWFVHFGPQPIFPYVSLEWPEGYRELMEKLRTEPTIEGMRDATREMMTLVSENAVIIPLITQTTPYIVADYVRTERYKDHFMVWHTYLDWLDK
jgi:peptide/nickel transport system substrate-binding protein